MSVCLFLFPFFFFRRGGYCCFATINHHRNVIITNRRRQQKQKKKRKVISSYHHTNKTTTTFLPRSHHLRQQVDFAVNRLPLYIDSCSNINNNKDTTTAGTTTTRMTNLDEHTHPTTTTTPPHQMERRRQLKPHEYPREHGRTRPTTAAQHHHLDHDDKNDDDKNKTSNIYTRNRLRDDNFASKTVQEFTPPDDALSPALQHVRELKGQKQNDSSFHTKGVYANTEEYYKAFFKDRDRKLDVVRGQVRQLLSQQAQQEKQWHLRRKKPRIRTKDYWYGGAYNPPNLEEVDSLKGRELKHVLMNEAHQLAKGSRTPNPGLWPALAARAATLRQSVAPKSLLRVLQALAAAKYRPDQHFKAILDELFERRKELQAHQKVYVLQALARLRWRDQLTVLELNDMILAWPMLKPNFLIKSCNSISKLDFAEHALAAPLKQALVTRLPYLDGRLVASLKCVSVLELLDTADHLHAYLLQCYAHRKHFRSSGRTLAVMELYLRLLRPDVYSELPDHIKLFLEEARIKLNEQKSDDMDDSYLERETVSQISYITRDISEILESLRVTHFTNIRAGPFHLDVYEPSTRSAIEICTGFQFYVSTTRPTVAYKWRRTLLEAMGFRLVRLSEADWLGCSTTYFKEEYLRKLLPATVFAGAPRSASAQQARCEYEA